MRKYSWLPFLAIYMLAVLVGITTTKSPQPITASEVVKKAEAERLATIRKVKQASVCVFVKEGNNILGGGSGVLIDKDGYCLTNYHVVAGQGFTGFRPTFVCSLPNGQMYDAVTVGTDKVGDVALIKLFPNKEGEEFPFVEMCDSDQIRPGEWSIIIGNPSLLATDFDPSISFGLISGVNRYRDFGFAEHTDALQYDTAANKGNSGGPIFNLKGELMGLVFGGNSVKRGSMNNGVGYGIPVNKIKNFLGHLRSGNACDHATLGATVASEGNDEAELPKMLVNAVMDNSDAARRGIGEGDLLLSFAGRPLLNANTFKSALGIYPKEWRLPITFQKGKTRKETLVRLMSYTPQEVSPGPKKGPLAPPPKAFGKGAQFFEAKPGFVNYYFNRQERDRLLAGSRKLADMREAKGDWLMVGTYASEARNGDFSAKIFLEDDKYAATLQMGLTDYKVVPAIPNQSIEDISEPPFSGGLAMSLLYYRRFLTKEAEADFNGGCHHGGYEPIYPMPLDASKAVKFEDVRIMAEVIRGKHITHPVKYFFYNSAINPQFKGKHPYPEGALIAMELFVDPKADPCELYFHEFKDFNGKTLPSKIDVRHAEKRFALITLNNYVTK